MEYGWEKTLVGIDALHGCLKTYRSPFKTRRGKVLVQMLCTQQAKLLVCCQNSITPKGQCGLLSMVEDIAKENGLVVFPTNNPWSSGSPTSLMVSMKESSETMVDGVPVPMLMILTNYWVPASAILLTILWSTTPLSPFPPLTTYALKALDVPV